MGMCEKPKGNNLVGYEWVLPIKYKVNGSLKR